MTRTKSNETYTKRVIGERAGLISYKAVWSKKLLMKLIYLELD